MKPLFLPPLLMVLFGAACPAFAAGSDSDLSLVLHGPTNVIKQGDEIPIEFVVSNHGTTDYQYTAYSSAPNVPIGDFKLTAKTDAGETVPATHRPDDRATAAGFDGIVRFLHPGESFSNTFSLNRWMFINAGGQYEVTGTYLPASFSKNRFAPVIAAPLHLTVLPRNEEEMAAYVKDLTDQAAAKLAIRLGLRPRPADPAYTALLIKLMDTGRPEIVPPLLQVLYEDNVPGFSPADALLYDVPKTEETWQTILQAATRQGLKNYETTRLLSQYNVNNRELRPFIERALALHNPSEWQAGAELAGGVYYDDAFTPRLIAIALDTSLREYVRRAAITALTMNRTDAGVKAVRSLLNEPNTNLFFWYGVAESIEHGYNGQFKSPTRRLLQPGDFDAQDLSTIEARFLDSEDPFAHFEAVVLALLVCDDSLSPKLAALALDPKFDSRHLAMEAVAVNRTDEGLKTLKTLLDDSDPEAAAMAEKAIRYGYNPGFPSLGKRLQPDDFDAKFQKPKAPDDAGAGAKLAALTHTSTVPAPVNSAKPEGVPSGLSLVIQCAANVLKMGDEIPIKFTIHNDSTELYTHATDDDMAYTLTAKTISGESLSPPHPGPRGNLRGSLNRSGIGPGGSFFKIIPLNGWAAIKEPGRYEVSATYFPEGFGPISAGPISVTVLPRAKE